LSELLPALREAAAAMSFWEAAAVALAVTYLLLAIRQHAACWPAAIVSSGIYVVLMYQAGLYMESLLQFFYIAMAVYGWYCWTSGGPRDDGLAVSSWPPAWHAPPLLLIAMVSLLSGWLLERYTQAAYPYADSFTTWAAIVPTWMVARKVLQNWHYWFVIDAVSVWLYYQRGLLLTAGLFVVYLVLIVFGYRAWRETLRQEISEQGDAQPD